MILTAPETGFLPLFKTPDSPDNSNLTTRMEADSGGHEANTSPDGEQLKVQSMPQSGSSSEEAASLTSRSHPSNLMDRISSPKKPKTGEENNSLPANINLGSLGINELLSGYWTSSRSYQSFQPVPLGGRSSVPKRRSPGVSIAQPCQEGPQISKMIQEFGEMERLGEATFTIITTPSVTAVWVVAFTLRTFKKIEDMIQPLWQSRSTVSNYS